MHEPWAVLEVKVDVLLALGVHLDTGDTSRCGFDNHVRRDRGMELAGG